MAKLENVKQNITIIELITLHTHNNTPHARSIYMSISFDNDDCEQQQQQKWTRKKSYLKLDWQTYA